jgi:hypothetical protein
MLLLMGGLKCSELGLACRAINLNDVPLINPNKKRQSVRQAKCYTVNV